MFIILIRITNYYSQFEWEKNKTGDKTISRKSILPDFSNISA